MKASLLTVATIFLCLTSLYSQTQPPQSSASATPSASPEVKAANAAAATSLPAEVAGAKPAGGRPALPPEKANPVKLVRFAKPPVIDGKIDDEVWKSAVVLKDFYQVQPGDNIAPSKPT
jgi:hypothetical protein